MRSLLLGSLCCVLLLTFGACSTVKGLGDDISTVGHWFVKGSDKVKNAEAK